MTTESEHKMEHMLCNITYFNEHYDKLYIAAIKT